MKKISLYIFMMMLAAAFAFQTSAAQFNIKIPKIVKPKVEQPKPEQSTTGQPNADGGANKNPAGNKQSEVVYMEKPRPTGVAVLLKDSLEIKVHTRNTYWKMPDEQYYSSWIPLISFNIFHDKSETVRYTAEWLNPDGSVWFSEDLDGTQNRAESAILDTKATASVGAFGLRLLNTKTREVVFKGKFNVKKILLDPASPRYKNQAMFYVDNDWSLPIGYVGFNDSSTWDFDPKPVVYIWLKGDLKSEDFEARLFHNNRQIASTADGGSVYEGDDQRNDTNCFQQTEVCRYRLWQFSWNLKVESFNQDATNAKHSRDPKAIYTKDKPGEYIVKVFHKGVQVRETRFTVQPNGWLAPNAFASQIPMKNYRAVIPVKVLGTLDKWSPVTWKTEAFYGNPLSEFVAP